ncbi:MAG TPA: PKD domain-containing protein, partial [Phaeodactylibacter sp.]|nr:PKD domain-containing protein [Phaeodactylibacter sp.]
MDNNPYFPMGGVGFNGAFAQCDDVSLCDVPQAISNGSFETADTGPGGCALYIDNLGGTSGYLGAFLDGCVNDWSAGGGDPDVFSRFSENNLPEGVEAAQEGENFAYLDIEESFNEINTQSILQDLNLVPCVRYNMSFWAQSVRQTLDFQLVLTNGLSPSGTNVEWDDVPVLPQNSVILFDEQAPSDLQWEQYTTTFVADNDNTQLIIFPDMVSDADGLFIDNITITPCTSPLNVGFTASQSGVNTYDFFDLTSTTATNEAEAWCWDFGDGSPVSNEQNPTHTYADGGSYEVCLTIRDTEGCIRQVCQPIDNQVTCNCQDGFLELGGDNAYNWSSDQIINHNLIIRTGSRLSLQDMTLTMAPNCRIYVERGARLEADNTTVTTDRTSCPGKFWSGIEVWGNGALEHPPVEAVIAGYPFSNDEHGVVYITNQSEISFARIGVLADNEANTPQGTYWNPYSPWGGHYGGIVYAENSFFLNNRRGAHIGPFPAFNQPNSPTNQISNISRFVDCTFADPLDVGFGGVSAYESEDLLFEDCTFKGINKEAINLLNAKATVRNSIFDRGRTGVQINHTPGYLTPEFETYIGADNTFRGLIFGVAASGTGDLTVKGNLFEQCGLSVSVEGPSQYYIENNSFINSGARSVQLSNTFVDFANAELNCNFHSFTGNVALNSIMASGDNSNFTFNHETFVASNINVEVRQSGSILGEINPAQGSLADPHLNRFAGILRAEFGETSSFNYYHPGDNLLTVYPELRPNDIGQNFMNIPVDLAIEDYDDGCLDLPSVGEDVTHEEPCTTRACLDAVYQELRQIRQLIDGGDTEGLVAAIQNNPTATATYQALVDAIPYLSDEVLNALVNSGISVTQRDYLLQQAAPLSSQMMHRVSTIVSSTTYQLLENKRQSDSYSPMEEKIAERSQLEKQRAQAITYLLRSYLLQDSLEQAEELLLQDSS